MMQLVKCAAIKGGIDPGQMQLQIQPGGESQGCLAPLLYLQMEQRLGRGRRRLNANFFKATPALLRSAAGCTHFA